MQAALKAKEEEIDLRVEQAKALNEDKERYKAENARLKQPVTKQDEGIWVIKFEDIDRSDEIFVGAGAANAALLRYERVVTHGTVIAYGISGIPIQGAGTERRRKWISLIA